MSRPPERNTTTPSCHIPTRILLAWGADRLTKPLGVGQRASPARSVPNPISAEVDYLPFGPTTDPQEPDPQTMNSYCGSSCETSFRSITRTCSVKSGLAAGAFNETTCQITHFAVPA